MWRFKHNGYVITHWSFVNFLNDTALPVFFTHAWSQSVFSKAQRQQRNSKQSNIWRSVPSSYERHLKWQYLQGYCFCQLPTWAAGQVRMWEWVHLPSCWPLATLSQFQNESSILLESTMILKSVSWIFRAELDANWAKTLFSSFCICKRCDLAHFVTMTMREGRQIRTLASFPAGEVGRRQVETNSILLCSSIG